MQYSKSRSITLCGLFAALIAIGAFIKIPVPGVPFTLQTAFTTLAGLLLGARLGGASAGLYMMLGVMGLPVFTQGGGPAYLLKPSFGYILGFVVGAYVTGWIAHKVANPSYKRLLAASFAGMGVVYLLGMVYFYAITRLYLGQPMGLGTLVMSCFVMVAPGDVVTCFAVAALARRLLPILRKGQFVS